MRPFLLYDHYITSAYAADNSTFTFICAIAAAHRHPLLRPDIQSAFTPKVYRHEQPVHVRPIAKFERTRTYPTHPMCHLRLELYGNRSAYNIYYDGISKHLLAQAFNASELHPCM